MFELIAQLQELLKTYYIALRYDTAKATQILATINDWRLQIAKDASMRKIFWDKVLVPANATGYAQSIWFSRDDTEYILNRAVALLVNGATVSAINEGNKQRIFTREAIQWQQLFAQFSGFLFDYPQEILFAENEVLGLTIKGQTDVGAIYHHGCTLKDAIEDVSISELATEISSYLPEPQIVPIIFQFPTNVKGVSAVNASGASDIFSQKNAHSVILTHISATQNSYRVSIQDNARNHLLCSNVEPQGFTGDSATNVPYEIYRKLPYPHILRRGDRFKLTALNGNDFGASVTPANTLLYVSFKGYTM